MAATVLVVSRTISQPADGDDFVVTFSPPMPDSGYSVRPSIVQGAATTEWVFPGGGNRTTSQFRAQTLAALDDGDVVEFTLVRP